MIELRRAGADRAERRWLKNLFLGAFPPEERPPFRVMRAGSPKKADWWVIERDGERAGFFYVLRDEALAYLFFFAVDPSCRRQGVGTEALRQLMPRYAGRTFFLAIEPVEESAPNYAERVRRKRFYEACGLRELGQSVREAGVVYDLLGTGGRVDPAAYVRLMRAWMPPVCRRLVGVELLEGERT